MKLLKTSLLTMARAKQVRSQGTEVLPWIVMLANLCPSAGPAPQSIRCTLGSPAKQLGNHEPES